ncbi:hypothetical protein ALC62_07490 [Cyphomyrmex costatus]|uniref:Helix-turn-helix domain-containing protein n=1 Tax=Cyphomyrmex costatus TaxID=456900 RepID=A0A151IHN8_9HYME|nr:hypothetical protein ALC62_07490 [Cyphomyrmex costatus]
MLYKDNVLFYFRYVDDLCAAVGGSEIDSFFKAFNSFHPRLQFTLEIGTNSLNFLDISIIIKDNNLFFDWYQKPTFSGRFLNFYSNHPLSQKKSIIIGLVDRALILSHPIFHSNNLIFIIRILIENYHPLKLIFDYINDRIKNIAHDSSKNNNDLNDNNKGESSKLPSRFVVPYVPRLTDKFKQFNRNNIKVAYYNANKLRKYIKVHKDPLDYLSKTNVVYKINCNDCDASYVGQEGN